MNYKTLGFISKTRERKTARVIEKYLRHKGLEADQFVFTTKLFKTPSYRIAGFNIAVERAEFMGRSRVYFSLICPTT